MSIKKTLLAGAITGLIVGVLFIFVQPWFGMTELTVRHATAYTKLSGISPFMAIIIAWVAHLIVSAAYGIVSAMALLISRNLYVFGAQLIALGWFTTVIAGPANQMIVRVVTSEGFPSLANLPPLNFNLDAKLALHLVFFFAIGILLLSSRISENHLSKSIGQAS